MSYRDDTLLDRRDTAAKARQALLEKARSISPTNDPDFAARQAARAAANAAREEAAAQRRAARQAEAEAQAAAAAEARRIAEAEKLAAAEAAAKIKAPVPRSETEMKAARDAKYAARKARQR
jgi:hypothetical protein